MFPLVAQERINSLLFLAHSKRMSEDSLLVCSITSIDSVLFTQLFK